MSLDDLTPAARVAAVDAHLAAILGDEERPRFDMATGSALARMRFGLVDDDVSDEEFAERRKEWQAHLATLSEHDRDAATHELRRFVQILDGLHGPERDDEEDGHD
jgi:hypothetical protein